MNLVYTQEPSGNCPVQAEGTINGHEFYFRARGQSWALHVARTAAQDPLDTDAWHHTEPYNGAEAESERQRFGAVKYSAGWAEPMECREFIQRAAKLFIEANGS